MLEIMRIAAAVLISLAPLLVSAQAASTTPEALSRSLQESYQRVSDFSADFTHTYRGAALKTRTVEQGTVMVKKPGKMRWVYTKPERKEFVSDGTTLYTYLPEDKQVLKSRVPGDGEANTAALFLAGKGDIARDFTPSFAPAPQGTVALKLSPRRNEPDFEYFVVIVDPGTLQIRGLTTRDRQGGESTLTFTKLKENQRISDKSFEFRIPRGVDVVSTDD
jgi:outer membrane lipoprotein carrier protein